MKAVDIDWCVDNAEEQGFLPSEIEIPDEIDVDEVGDYISDVTGYCHYGFVLEK